MIFGVAVTIAPQLCNSLRLKLWPSTGVLPWCLCTGRAVTFRSADQWPQGHDRATRAACYHPYSFHFPCGCIPDLENVAISSQRQKH